MKVTNLSDNKKYVLQYSLAVTFGKYTAGKVTVPTCLMTSDELGDMRKDLHLEVDNLFNKAEQCMKC